MGAGLSTYENESLRAVSGIDDEIRRLYDEKYLSLVRAARFLLHDVRDAEEVVQDAYLSLYDAWPRLRDPGAASRYLTSTVLNRSRSRVRRITTRLRVVVPGPVEPASVAELVEGAQEHLSVVTALRSLPRRQQECLVLRFYLDLGEEAIADATGISRGSVKTHIHRGLRAIEKQLKEDG